MSKPVVCSRCYLSYTGTVAGCLGALGIDCDTVDVGGYSGYAFIVNVTKYQTDVSGPTALPTTSATSEGDVVWNEIIKATQSLGWTIEKYHDPGDCEVLRREPTPEERARAMKLFEKVKKEVDERNRPVVIWGLPVPDYGVAVGYEGDSYLVTTVYGDAKLEEPVPYDRLQAPGRIQALFFRDRVEGEAEVLDREALERAVRFASLSRSDPIWVIGPAAFDTWADALQNLPRIEDYWSGYGGNCYVAQCVRESRYIAAEFLERLSRKYSGARSRHLQESAKRYEKELRLMEEFTRIFPHKWPIPEDWRREVQQQKIEKGAEILKKMRPLEEAVVKEMKKALEEWKSAWEPSNLPETRHRGSGGNAIRESSSGAHI